MPAKKPNILVIWGDDIGMWNVGAYTHGMMGRTPNLDSIAQDGCIYTDHSGQPSCTAGRAAEIESDDPEGIDAGSHTSPRRRGAGRLAGNRRGGHRAPLQISHTATQAGTRAEGTRS